MIDKFLAWEENATPEIINIAFLLGEAMSDEPQLLISQATEAESLYSRLGFLLAEAQSYLEECALFFLPDPDRKELDRKTELQAKLAPIRKVRDKLKAMMDQVEFRITLAQSLLRHQSQLGEARVYKPGGTR